MTETSINTDVPQAPFQVRYKETRFNEPKLPAQWAIPFDVTFRDAELPNAPQGALPAYTSIGWHVTANPLRYMPAYNILGSFNLRFATGPTAAAWEASCVGKIVVTNVRTGMAYQLAPAISNVEAVVSWYNREHGHEDTVLCWDRAKNTWTVEPLRDELKVALAQDGTEVPVDESNGYTHYLWDQHPNLFIIYGS